MEGGGSFKPYSLLSGSPNLNGSRTTHLSSSSNSYLKMEEEGEDAALVTSNLRQELTRLQDRETLLTHLLLLEREKRVRAEQLVEVEHLACLELGHRLARESRKSAIAATHRTAALRMDHCERDGGGSLAQERREDITKRSDLRSKENTDSGLGYSPPTSSNGSDSGLVLVSPTDSDFSTAVFGQLTSDLRQMLGVGSGKRDSGLNSQTDSMTLAREAIATDNASVLQKCILSMDLDTITNEGESLLKLASEYGRTGCVKVLLESGSCNPNGRGSEATPTSTTPTEEDVGPGTGEDGITPLHLAAKNGHHTTLSLLLKSGADPHRQDNEGSSPIFLAARGGHADSVQTLMEYGARVASHTKLGETALHAAVLANSPAILRNLIVQMRIAMETVEMTSVLNHCDSDGRTALHLAASLGYKECAEVLCARPDVDTIKRDRWNRTPVDVATPSCKEILLNRESRQVVVYIESCGSSPVHSSSNLTVSDSDYRTAIGRISILQHHKLSDLELLVQESMRQYWSALKLFGNTRSIEDSCRGGLLSRGLKDKLIDGINFWDGCPTLHERILRTFSLSKSFVNQDDGSSVNQNFKDLYLKWSKAFLQLCRSRTLAMDLSEESILSYQIGAICWKPGEIPVGMKPKSLFNVFGELERQHGQTRGALVPMERESGKLMEVTVSLKGFREGCLDQLAFDSMIPLGKLKEYVNLVENHKALMIQGAQGTGKTYLALALANYFKYKYMEQGSQVIHTSLHPSFQRDNLFRLLHINGLLVPAPEKGEEFSGGRRSSTVHASRTYILVLDDLSNVAVPTVLAELLTALSYRGAEHPMWLSDVFSRDGALLYPCGYFYLYPRCYFIATQTTPTSGEREPSSIDQFPHVSLDCHSEPVAGVLKRQLTAKLIHCSLGDLPYSSSFLPRLLLWTVDIWLLYNHFVQSLDLTELACGIKHFLQCPLESKDPEVIINWVCSTWNLHLAPSIENTLQSNSRLSIGISNNPGRQFGARGSPPSNQSLEEHRYKALTQLLLACTRLVFLPTCPLQLEMRLKVVEQLTSRLEGLFSLSPGERSSCREKGTTEAQRKDVNVYSSTGTPPLSSHITNRGTPPTPIKERRGSLSKHSPSSSSSKAGNMVSYEDMIKNSPRNTPKVTRSKQQTPTSSRKAQLAIATEPVKPVTPVISSKKPPSGESSPPMIVDDVKLRQPGRSKTLRKLRSKTVALFSKEGGYSTLPRLFRKGSRASLTSFSEDDPRKPPPNEPHHIPTKSEKQQLNDLFDLLSSSAHSGRYEEQRSPPPENLPPKREGEDVECRGTDNDLDDIFDLMATINSDRIDDQRTAAPLCTPAARQDGAVSPDKSKKKNKNKVAKYFLPTGSPLFQRKSPVDRTSATSPTNYSMPDLTAEDGVPSATYRGHYPVTHSSSNTPSRARARLVSDAYVHCRTDNPGSKYMNGYRGHSYHSAHKSSVNKETEHVRSSSFSSESQYIERGGTSAYFRKRSGTYDYGSSSATEPVARRKISVYSRYPHQDHSLPSSHAASNPSVTHNALPPTSPLATTGYSSSYQDAFCYTDSDGGSPFHSNQHTRSNSTAYTGTASLNEGSPYISHQHTQSNSTTHTASQKDNVTNVSTLTMPRYQLPSDELQMGSLANQNESLQVANIPLDPAPSTNRLRSRKFQAKSEENLRAHDSDGGAFDLFRAASDGEINQSSTPSPYEQKEEEEDNSFQFRPTSQQPVNDKAEVKSTAIQPKGKGTSITMMHCNYHSIYPEESPQPAKVEKYFTPPSTYSGRTRSVSTTAADSLGFDGREDNSDIYRRRSTKMSVSPQGTPSKRRSDTYIYTEPSSMMSTAGERRHSTASAERRYRRNTSNSSEGSLLSQTLSSPTSKVPTSRGKRSSDALLFSATLGFSDLLNTGSRDRLQSQSHNHEVQAEM